MECDLWSKQVVHNGTAQWLENKRLDILNTVCPQEEFQITLDEVTKQLRRVNNWKAPGHDAIHGYWLKYLTNIHQRLACHLQDIFQKGPPEWLTLGRTVLVVKDVNKGMNPAKFRPITCLPTVWKLLTSILAEELYDHLSRRNLIPFEQKGCARSSRGPKDYY